MEKDIGTIVGVMGPGSSATEDQKQLANHIGMLVAEKGYVLLSGGMEGTMEAACRGAYEAGGLVIGICPTDNAKDMCPWVHIPIVTGMRGARNFINILSSGKVIAIGARSGGTLSEIAFALQQGRPLLVLGGTPEMEAYLPQIETKGPAPQFGKGIVDVGAFLG